MTASDDEPMVLRAVPYAVPDEVHGWVYLVFGTLAAGAPRWEPDPVETARRLAQPERWAQRQIWEEAA